MGETPYDRIGIGYAGHRRPDPRIAAQIEAVVCGSAGPEGSPTVLNVGAGAGSYELPPPVRTVAVEPAATMRAQRPRGSAPCLAAVAEALPVADGAFDVVTAFLTVHHWPQLDAGLRELRWVAAGQVVLTFDRTIHDRFWLVRDYLPEAANLAVATLADPTEIAARLGGGEIQSVPVPADCVDGFFWAWWKRPEAYLDASVRQSISGLARLPTDVVEPAMARLAEDLRTGRWHERNAGLDELDEIDGGYRLVVCG